MKKFDIRKLNYFSLLNFIVTFFVIATKKVTKEKSRQNVFVYRWSLIVCRKNAKNEYRITKNETARAFCLADATHFVYKWNSWRSLPLCDLCVK